MPRQKATKVVTETRLKFYDDWERGGNRGRGVETVKEINVCPRCASKGRT